MAARARAWWGRVPKAQGPAGALRRIAVAGAVAGAAMRTKAAPDRSTARATGCDHTGASSTIAATMAKRRAVADRMGRG